VVVLGFVLSVAFVIAIVPRLFVTPARIDQLRLVNQTAYATQVAVTDAPRSGWLRLGAVERGTTTVLEDVIDQGDEWTFRFQAQGFDGGELRFTREQLQRSDWQVVIAEPIGRRLAREGAQPTPIRDAS
jgi:hypothetical protein